MAVTTTTAALNGLAGGVAATIVMTIGMMTLGDDSPPPTAAFWAKYIGGGDPADYMPQGMALHFIYGVVAGVVFAAGTVVAGLDVVGNLTMGLVGGIVYGIVLFLVAAVFWMNVVLDMDPEREEVLAFVGFHLVYGIVLGAVAGTGILT